jgi:hypothetical protein
MTIMQTMSIMTPTHSAVEKENCGCGDEVSVTVAVDAAGRLWLVYDVVQALGDDMISTIVRVLNSGILSMKDKTSLLKVGISLLEVGTSLPPSRVAVSVYQAV